MGKAVERNEEVVASIRKQAGFALRDVNYRVKMGTSLFVGARELADSSARRIVLGGRAYGMNKDEISQCIAGFRHMISPEVVQELGIKNA